MPLPSSVFTQRQIFAFWLPLAASWALMSAEGPVLQAAIARLPDMQTQLAAFGIVMSLEITIESPVIMLLATSTALSSNAGNYRTLRRFMLWINSLVTVAAAMAAFTPAYGVIVEDVMGIPGRIAAAARPGMQIMTLWSAAIGWRRFHQGVLIRHGETRWVGIGTVWRLVATAGTAVSLAVLTSLPGVHIATSGLMAGVIVEALFVARVVRPTVSTILDKKSEDSGDLLTLGQVARYHLPLAATSLLTLLAQPLIGAGLARMPFPEENLAAWPIVWGVLFVFRSPSFALPEAVIALVGEPRLVGPVRSFCRRVGWASSAFLAVLAGTPLLALYLRYVAGLPDRLSKFVVPGLVVGIALPLMNSIHSWFRGVLMARRSTETIYRGMGLNLCATAILMLAGVIALAPGVETAVVALTIPLILEIYFLRHKAVANSTG